jgi:hypothetical protein
LFLNGRSQGPLNTQWLNQELQRRDIKVAATAARSPFNDLPDTFHYWSSPQSFIPSAEKSYPLPPVWIVPCVIVLLGSYRRNYGLTDLFETAIKPQYRAFAEKYWSDYSLDGDLTKAIPLAADFLTDGFFERFTHATNGRLHEHHHARIPSPGSRLSFSGTTNEAGTGRQCVEEISVSRDGDPAPPCPSRTRIPCSRRHTGGRPRA